MNALYVILGFFGFLISIAYLVEESLYGRNRILGPMVAAIISIIAVIFIMYGNIVSSHEQGYRVGQIDALNGEWKYESKIDTAYHKVDN